MITMTSNAFEMVDKVMIHVSRELFDYMLLIQQDVMDQMGQPSPPKSQPGEPLHKKTGTAQQSVSLIPTTPEGVRRKRSISIYFNARGWYAYYHADQHGRMSLRQMVMKAMGNAVAGGRGAYISGTSKPNYYKPSKQSRKRRRR